MQGGYVPVYIDVCSVLCVFQALRYANINTNMQQCKMLLWLQCHSHQNMAAATATIWKTMRNTQYDASHSNNRVCLHSQQHLQRLHVCLHINVYNHQTHSNNVTNTIQIMHATRYTRPRTFVRVCIGMFQMGCTWTCSNLIMVRLPLEKCNGCGYKCGTHFKHIWHTYKLCYAKLS